MIIDKRNLNNIFFVFLLSHLVIWTIVPSVTNDNLPLDIIEGLAWGSNLDWGSIKHPPMNPFFLESFFLLFGAQDWVFYFLSQVFVIFSFYIVFKLANEIFKNKIYSLISVLLLETIYFYNFTTPEFNVNICQLPFWSLVVFYSWKIFDSKQIKFIDCFLIGLFAAIGFLSKYLFLYLLLSIFIFFIYSIYIKKIKKFDFKYIIIIEIFLILLVPHFIWLYDNQFITIIYAIKRSGLEQSQLINNLFFPIIFLVKQFGILLPFLLLSSLFITKFKFKKDLKDRKLLFLLFINFMPIFLIFITSVLTGSKIRTMWMTPYYLFFGVLVIYLFEKHISLKKMKLFLYMFLFLFFLSPGIYSYVSITQTDKRTDYPGKEIASKVQLSWNKNFEKEIEFVIGDEWKAGNLSYHLKSRPRWEGYKNDKLLNNSSQFICVDDVCLGRY